MPVGSNKPVETIRAGGVNIPIWKNERQFNGKNVISYNYTVQRAYTDKQGKWQNTNSFETKHLVHLIGSLWEVWKKTNELKKKDRELVTGQETI